MNSYGRINGGRWSGNKEMGGWQAVEPLWGWKRVKGEWGGGKRSNRCGVGGGGREYGWGCKGVEGRGDLGSEAVAPLWAMGCRCFHEMVARKVHMATRFKRRGNSGRHVEAPRDCLPTPAAP